MQNNDDYLGIKLPKKLKEKLAKEAKKQDRSLSWIIRQKLEA